MGLGKSIKDKAFQLFNGGFTSQEITISKILGITPQEYRSQVEAEAIKTHESPYGGYLRVTLFNNSKYKPSGELQEPGSIFNDYTSKEGKEIVKHNQKVMSNANNGFRSVTARMTGVRGPSSVAFA